MRIHFDNVNFQSRTGPNTFADRLTKSLFTIGHQVQLDATNADVSLVFIERSGKPLASKVVQRLDGLWFRPQDFASKNVDIKTLYDRSDAVIYQSDFDMTMASKWFGKHKHGEVIHNGIDMNVISDVTIPELVKIRSTYDKVFVCSSNWHPQKRLKSNIKLFDHLRRTQFPNSCLFILGANPDVMVTDPHVFYTGSQPLEVYMQVFAVADWMIHLAWADHCPNVIVEALSQGTPVICSEVGGTKELIGAYGMILKEAPYDFELFDYDNPPVPYVEQVTHLPTRHDLDHAYADIIPLIDIRDVTRKYVSVFEGLIK